MMNISPAPITITKRVITTPAAILKADPSLGRVVVKEWPVAL